MEKACCIQRITTAQSNAQQKANHKLGKVDRIRRVLYLVSLFYSVPVVYRYSVIRGYHKKYFGKLYILYLLVP